MAAKFSAVAANYYSFPPVDSDATIKINREKRGMCGGCGTKIFSFRRSLAGFKEYIPLNIEGIVSHGRCLYCYPIVLSSNLDLTFPNNRILQQRLTENSGVPFPEGKEIRAFSELDEGECFEVNSMPEPSAPPLLDTSPYQDKNVDLLNPILCDKEQGIFNVKETVFFTSFEKKEIINTSIKKNIRIIINEMKHKTCCSYSQYLASERLFKILIRNISLRDYVGILGAIPLFFATMEIHYDNVLVQQRACALFMVLANKTDSNRKIIQQLNGVERIAKSIRYHCSNIDLICVGCGALWSLSFNNVKCRNAVRKSGTISLILKLMEQHIHDTKLHEWGIGLLHTVTLKEPNPNDIISKDAVLVLKKIMKINPLDNVKRCTQEILKSVHSMQTV